MKIIITGATGFIGRNLAQGLVADGAEVTAMGRSSEVRRQLQAEGIDCQAADLLDRDGLTRALGPADCVVHCAARAGDWGKEREFHEANVIGTRNLIDACRAHDIGKMVFLSTPSVYFDGTDRTGIRESDPLPDMPASHYARTKLQAEAELLALADDGFRTIVLRPRAVFGPHDNTIIPRILRMADKRRFPLVNGGRALVDLTCIDNLLSAIRLSLNAPDEAWNEVYNISNGTPITVRAWFSQVLEIFGRPFRPIDLPEALATAVAVVMEGASRLPFGPKTPSMTRFSVGYMARSMTLSIEKARERLGYHPDVSLQEGFRRYERWSRLERNDVP